MSKRTPMIEQYLDIKQAYPDTLLFFRLGDFYELFYEDAQRASALLQITLTGRGVGDTRMPMCGVPYHAAEGYIGKLVAHGLKVAICEQVEDPKATKGLVRREVVRVVTPGTAFEYAREGDARLLLATAQAVAGDVDGSRYMVTTLDAMTGESWQREGELVTLGAWLTGLQVAEYIWVTGMSADLCQWLQTQATYSGAAYSQFLTPVLPRQHEGSQKIDGYELLVRYTEYTGKRALDHLQLPQQLSADAHLHLSAAALAHLELLQPLTTGRKLATLFEVLDATGSAMGKRTLREWIARPLAQIAPIHARQEAIERLLDDSLLLADLSSQCKGLPDVARLTSRISFATAGPRDLVQLAHALERACAIKALLAGVTTSPWLQAAQLRINVLQGLTVGILETLVDEPPVGARDGGIIRQGVDAQIDHLRDLAQGGRSWIAALEQEERVKTGIRSLKIAYNRVFGYYIEVTSANAHLVPERYERKQTLSSGERFVTPELRAREGEILQADERSKELEYLLFTTWLEKAHEELAAIQEVTAALGELDALLALAETARRHHFIRPKVDESRDLEIRFGRHPVVERTTAGAYVPNDVRLYGDRRLIGLITGPNMAGKSTYMRQVALIVVLAQMGSFVPADDARIGLVDKLFTRIGASDDVSAGLSTFMVEMTEMAEILQGATDRSFVILDEVGRGTATYDGMSIAEAVVEYMHDHTRARTLFATHYHELTAMPARLPYAFNLSVAVAEHGDQIVFLHQIVERPADRSYGIQVARKAGLPQAITMRAQEILAQLEARPTGPVYEQMAATLFTELDSPEEPITEKERELLAALREVSLDELSPREALSFLYDLRARMSAD